MALDRPTTGRDRDRDRDRERRYAQLSPFEFKATLTAMADARNQELNQDLMLKAGRGNPNWLATTPREAFFLLGQFSMTEARRVWDEPGIAGQPRKAGMAARLAGFLVANADAAGADLLSASISYGIEEKGFDPDEWVYELTDAILGDNYPSPDRMLTHIEQVVSDYLVKEMCGPAGGPPGGFDIFAVEGGTAAMCYLFETLLKNYLLEPGDKIAIGLPIFTPYIEIPELPGYGFEVVKLEASELDHQGFHAWQFPDEEIDKLRDPAIKALFLVNPSNPPSHSIRPRTLELIAEVIEESNPNLIVITDDVYGTFVSEFRSLMDIAPRNTILVYSFSKYFGCTGWRLGTIAVNRDNIFDEMLRRQGPSTQSLLLSRYRAITLEVDELRFIDRVVADSRHVALNHTAGLSLPQQVQMVLFALAALLDPEDRYKRRLKEILQRRLDLLCEGTGVQLTDDPLRAGYYVELDLLLWADMAYGPEFCDFITQNYEPIDFVIRLAEQESVVLLNGGGFDAPEWSIRVSLANLDDDAYARIGRAIARISYAYLNEFEAAGGSLVRDRVEEARAYTDE